MRLIMINHCLLSKAPLSEVQYKCPNTNVDRFNATGALGVSSVNNTYQGLNKKIKQKKKKK